MSAWLYLLVAIAFEIVATTLLKASDGFTRLGVGAASIACYALSLYLLSQLLRAIPIGIAYALWSGIGIVAISIIGRLFMNQKLDTAAVIGIALIVCGVLVINLFSKAGTH
ncbi:MAG: SMR family transporter [Neisseria sp.]|nr:SMR family transporter [Neisseria sp.]